MIRSPTSAGALRPRRLPHLRLLLPILGFAATAGRAEVQIERLTLPHHAAPSSFAIGLPGGINFCFDPVRGSVNYVWTGAFLDVAPARPGTGKFIGPAILLGPVVYREAGPAPLRRGSASRIAPTRFPGYTLRPEAVEFRYTVDGVLVRETILRSADGGRLIRRLQIEEPGSRWWRVIEGQEPAELQRDTTGTAVIELLLPAAGS